MDTNKTINQSAGLSQRQAALTAGFGLLIMTFLAIFANFTVFQQIIVFDNASETVNNILKNEVLFRLGIGSFIIVIILDIIVAWSLYYFVKPVNKSLSLLTAMMRFVYAAIFAVALVNYFDIIQFLKNPGILNGFETPQLNAQVMIFINGFEDTWNIGYMFFGIHLLLLGYLIYKSGYGFKLLGILIVISGLGYFIDSLGEILLSGYHMEISIFTFIGELIFMFWLLFKGGKTPLKQ